MEKTEWIASARRVANSLPPLVIPHHILVALDRAINFRHEHRDTLFKIMARGVQWGMTKLFRQSDQSHLHLKQVLEEVRQILMTVKPVVRQLKPASHPIQDEKTTRRHGRRIAAQTKPQPAKVNSESRYAQLQTENTEDTSEG